MASPSIPCFSSIRPVGDKNLVAASEPSIGNTPDGEFWFAPVSDILFVFNPKTNSWRAYFGRNSAFGDTNSARMFTDGAVCRLAFDYRSEYTPPEPGPAGWKIYDGHTFGSAEIQTMPLNSRIKSVRIDPNGILWLAHTDRISRFNSIPNDWYLYDLYSTNGALSEEPQDLAISNSSSLWIASGYAHSMAFQFTPKSSSYKSGAWHMYDLHDGIPDYKKLTLSRLTIMAKYGLVMIMRRLSQGVLVGSRHNTNGGQQCHLAAFPVCVLIPENTAQQATYSGGLLRLKLVSRAGCLVFEQLEPESFLALALFERALDERNCFLILRDKDKFEGVDSALGLAQLYG